MHSQKQKCIYRQDIERIKSLILSNRHITVFTHANADPDALASSCVLTYILRNLNKDATINVAIPEGIGIESRNLADVCIANGIDVLTFNRRKIWASLGENMLCFLVDTASAEQLKTLKNSLDLCRYIVVIDHHEARDLSPNIDKIGQSKGILEIVCPEASSTSEMVFEISKHLGVSLTRDLLELLISGIIWDTKRFLRASTSTFKCLSEMLEQGADYYRAQQLISIPKPHYMKIAKIRCVLRHKGFKVSLSSDGEAYIALSKVGAYESECASALINIGYDVAFVVSEEEKANATRVIYRAREGATLLQSIDIYNDILRRIVHKYGGGGGGHKIAGGAIINIANAEQIFKEILEMLGMVSNGNIVELAEHRVLDEG